MNELEALEVLSCVFKWAKYIAMDESGMWCLYESKPRVIEFKERRGSGYFASTGGRWTSLPHSDIHPAKDWRYSATKLQGVTA